MNVSAIIGGCEDCRKTCLGLDCGKPIQILVAGVAHDLGDEWDVAVHRAADFETGKEICLTDEQLREAEDALADAAEMRQREEEAEMAKARPYA